MADRHALALVARLLARALSLGAPPPLSTEARLANIPVRGVPSHAPVHIRWDRHQIPSIEAESLHDLAVGLGVVHAHLRLAQLEAMRRLATARVAEAIGPAGIELDRAILLMDLTRAVPEIEARLPPATRLWGRGFVAGINHIITQAPSLPHEFQLLRLRPTPWTLRDLLAVSRLAATDMSWLVFARLLRARTRLDPASWRALWPMLQAGDNIPSPGSNSAAVAASASATGAGLIASDPHLSVAQPPLWLIAALHAPGLDAVGLMIPGIPAIALGRNRALAWGGTNLHAASSDLVDVSGEAIDECVVSIPVRDAAPACLRLRHTRFGPVVSDGLLLRSASPLALRWVGHRASDELTALLGILQAGSLDQFRDALRGFAVPGQTMVAVEAGPRGSTGRTIAAHVPRRANTTMPDLVTTPDALWDLDDLVVAADFAAPIETIVASANDRPHAAPISVGFFFAPPDRVRRLRTLLETGPITAATMVDLQHDVLQPGALALRDLLLSRCPPLPPRDTPARRVLAEWDGRYEAASAGALVFEVLTANLARRLIPRTRLAILAAVWSGRGLVGRTIAHAPPGAIRAAFAHAARAWRRHHCWGAAHRMALRHPLAALPLIGRRYAGCTFAADGSNDTLNKSGHGLVFGRHRVTYGAGARHVSDLADDNANHFVLLGGQDGWLGSANTLDQVAVWRNGGSITVPLDAAPTREWPHETILSP
ncbi:penicillin acylase family protein [Lichenicoccus sp.]|uniref:penicillin acylase family protein n=1 Tax=Lichenicoccus sp. TaxID=2781899 RepID=UPI003D0F26DB